MVLRAELSIWATVGCTEMLGRRHYGST